MAPVKPVVEMGDNILGMDGCLNFLQARRTRNSKAEFNFYDVHYAATHVCSNSGGNTQDMREVLKMMGEAGSAFRNDYACRRPELRTRGDAQAARYSGGKKLIYTQIDMPLTAIDDFAELGKTDAMFAELAKRSWNARMGCGLRKRSATCSKMQNRSADQPDGKTENKRRGGKPRCFYTYAKNGRHGNRIRPNPPAQ